MLRDVGIADQQKAYKQGRNNSFFVSAPKRRDTVLGTYTSVRIFFFFGTIGQDKLTLGLKVPTVY